MKQKTKHWMARAVVAAAILTTSLPSIHQAANPHHFDMARGFLSGSLWIDEASVANDVGEHSNRHFVPFPPLPALIAMIAELSPWPDEVFNSIIVFSSVMAVLLAGRLGDSLGGLTVGTWAAFALGLGSNLWSATVIHDTYHSAHVLAVLTLTSALWLGMRQLPRASTAGLAMGLGILARQTMVCGLPSLAGVTAASSPQGSRSRVFIVVLMTASCVAAVYPALNWARFGSPLETGYGLVHHHPSIARDLADHGVFSSAFVERNLDVMLKGGPLQVSRAPYFVPNPRGMSVLLVSPWLLLAFLPLMCPDRRGVRAIAAWSWLAVLLVSLPAVLYVNTGWVQFGYRFALDWLPFLLLAAIVGIRGRSRWISLPPLVAAIVVNSWGVAAILNWESWSRLVR